MPIRGTEDKREFDKERLKELAFIDDLTGLYNRRYLYQYLPTELREIQRMGKKLCLFMMDIDNFKHINDAYGHLCGDKILVETAEILLKAFREGDTVMRYAGDEFVAILPGADEADAINIAQRIIEKIDKNPFRESEGKPTIHVTISIGLAVFPRDAQDPEKLIYEADQALYSSKRGGRNRLSTIRDISAEILDETKLEKIFAVPPLIGRQSQLDRLKELLDLAEKGEAKFVVIKGERGTGKTRLLDEFKKHAQPKGITNISVTCSPEVSAQPFQILIKALENLFVSLGLDVREFIRSLPEAQIIQLANYIPALKQFLPEELKVAKTHPSEDGQIDLFKGICQSLIYIIKRNTLLLMIDDFHWIDKETLELFDYMIKDLGKIPLMIVTAYREEELQKRTDPSSPGEVLEKMRKERIVEELILEPLTKEEILKLIVAIFVDIQLNPEFLDVVYNVSVGNPLFTQEVLRSLVTKGLIYYQEGNWYTKEISEVTLPPFLKEAIQRRIAELDEETKPVVFSAAVMGEVFDFNDLCQLLDRDPGYVLEVVDRATKQHLIEPESPLQTDKFKFSSGAVRDIVYAGVDLPEKRDLHKKLAMIEEKTHKDNIAPVVGTLGYHFAQAQDNAKATLYANMLLEKVKHMPTYQDIFSFLQEAILEKVEEVVVPLSDASIKLIPGAIRSLRLATQNVRLYPTQSTIRRSFVEQAYKYLINILDKDSTLLISTAEGRIMANGEEIADKAAGEAGADAFVALMIEHRIKTITFKRNLPKEQFVIFLEGLSQNYDDLISLGGLSGLLRKNDVTHLRVNEVRYEQTTKLTKQRVRFEEAMLIDYLIGKISGADEDKAEMFAQVADDPKRLAEALKKIAERAQIQKGQDKTEAQANIVAKSLQRLSDQVLSQGKGQEGQYRKTIAEALMSLDYRLRSKLLQTEVATEKIPTDKSRPQDIIRDALDTFSDEEILEIVTRELSDSGGDLTKMRSFIHRLLLEPKRKMRLLPKLKDKLLKGGMGEEETSWVLEENIWEGLSLEEKVNRLVKLPPESYIKLEVSKIVPNLASQLLERNQYSEASQIIDKLIKQLEDKSKEVRTVTLNDLDKISEILIFKEKYFLVEQIINSLIARLDNEKDPQVYSLVTQLLASMCVTLTKRQNFIQATGILKEFNLRLGKTSKLLDIQKQAIKEAKERTIATNPLVNWLTESLKSRMESHNDFYELSKVLTEIGTSAIGSLFALGIPKDPYADPFKNYALRWSIAKVLKSMGDEAMLYLKDRLQDKQPERIKTTLELLGHMQNKNAVQYLQPLLKAEDLDVRKETINTLGKIGGDEAIKLLSESVKEKNKQVRLAGIWALANIGGTEVLPILKSLLKDEDFSGEVKKIIQRIERK